MVEKPEPEQKKTAIEKPIQHAPKKRSRPSADEAEGV